MQFVPENSPSFPESGEEWCFAFVGDRLLFTATEKEALLPRLSDLYSLGLTPQRKQYIGRIDGTPCFAVELAGMPCPQGMALEGLRQLYGALDEELFWAAGRAFQIIDWDRNHLYCSRCGVPMRQDPGRHAKVCPGCGLTNYPPISPAMIVAVTQGDKILLARNNKGSFKFYSVLAGFVEAGESLEDCVRREVREEVGIEVKNIAYFGSQPWPFPNSLMVAFTAEYAGGEIQADEDEITDAGWFSVQDLPPIPGKISIAWRLIDWFIRSRRPCARKSAEAGCEKA